MERKRRSFTREFKLEAVRLLRDNGHTVAAVARDLGVNGTMLRRWKAQAEARAAEAFPGKGRQLWRDEELRQLVRENHRLRQERDILKKALSITSTPLR
jgi:transposase